MSKPVKQIHLAAHFPGVNNTTVWSDPAGRQPHRVRLLPPLRPDRRAGQVRLPVPGRGAAAARAERPDLRPGRGRPPGHVHGPGRAGRGDRAARAGRHDQLDLQRALRGGPPVRHASITFPAGGPPGTWSPRWDAFTGENFRRGGFLAQDDRYDRARTFLHTTRRAVRFLARRRDRGRPGWPGAFLAEPDAGAFDAPRPLLRHRRASSTCRAARRAGR